MRMERGTSIGSSATGNPLPRSGTNEAATTSRSTHHAGIHAARSHPLYPILQHIAQNLRQCQKQVKAVDLRTRKMEKDHHTVSEALEELKSLLKQKEKRTFNLKDAGFEVLKKSMI